MSFPKAKLKRFNDIPVLNSPFFDRKEKKECKSAGKDKEKEKEDKREQMDEKIVTKSLSSEKDTTKSSFRLFRTPSLPKRLRFRNNSDLTPTKSSKKAAAEAAQIVAEINARAALSKEKEALFAAQAEIKTKSETISESESLIGELKKENQDLKITIEQLKNDKEEIIKEKNSTIGHLQREIDSINQADEMIKKIAESSIEKINRMTEEMANITRDHELEIARMRDGKSALENKIENLSNELSRTLEENNQLYQTCGSFDVIISNLKMTLDEKVQEINDHQYKMQSVLEENIRLLEDIENVERQSEEDMIAYVDETKNLFDEIENYKIANFNLISELATDRSTIEQFRNQVNELEHSNQNLIKKYDQQMMSINEMHDMKIKELESVFILEKSKLQKQHNEQLSEMDINHLCEIERMTELNEEKIRISEIQFEEKLKLLESSLMGSVEQERIMWKNEIDKCQKIAEREIMQSEFEKSDLKELLDCANELVREKDQRIEELERKINHNIDNSANIHGQCQVYLDEAKKECARIMTEKYNYQITLNNTRSTVNILMERLQKSDSDVEMFKENLEKMTMTKNEVQVRCQKLAEEVAILKGELDEYKTTLSALKYSSEKLENEMKNRETVFENIIMSEEETLKTVDQIGKIFDEKLEENITKYFEMYNELKKKYEHRESYIKDMKTLLDEFVAGIEIARLEIEVKNTKLGELENENREIKLENMTLKFKMEQLEQYENLKHEQKRIRTNTPEIPDSSEETEIISHILLENIINHLETDTSNEITSTEEKDILNDFLIKRENEYVQENVALKSKVEELEKQLEQFVAIPKLKNLKESNNFLKNKITDLSAKNRDQESKIGELKEKLKEAAMDKTPIKPKFNGETPKRKHGTPKTPKTPSAKTPVKLFAGKENQSPATGLIASPIAVLRTRNN